VSGRTLAYQPALDGLRALAVALVLCFHGGFTWMTGGYVGVSVFFTLSGYLITSLLLVEHDRTGRIDLRSFYTRRVKRLLPASLVLLAVVVLAAAFGAWRWDRALTRDVVGSALQVENWVKLFGDASYADLVNASLGRVAPLEHYWSLSIEEQFYWVWPLVMLAVLRRARSRRRVTMSVGAMALVGAIAAPVIAAVWGGDAAYWSTPARMGEILVGAALAALLHEGRRVPRTVGRAAPLALVVVLVAAVTWPAASGPAYRGWLPVFALASTTLIAGLQVDGPVRRLLSLQPLVWLGTISYGVYLYHWPIFAVVTADRVSLDGAALFALRVGITLIAAVMSYRLIERPIRRSAAVGWRPVLTGAAASLAVAVAAIVMVPARTGTWVAAADAEVAAAADIESVSGSLAPLVPVTTLAALSESAPSETAPSESAPSESAPSESAPSESAPSESSPPAAAPTAPTTTVGATAPLVPVPAVSRPVRIVVVGDSTAQSTAEGLVAWAADHRDIARVRPAATPGCGFLRDGVVPTDGSIDWVEPCRLLLDDQLPAVLADTQPDVVMLMVTMRDVENRVWSDGEGPLDPLDPRYRERMLVAYRTMAGRLVGAGVPRIAWVLPPKPIAPFEGAQRVMRDPARYEVQHDVIRQVAAEYPDVVRVVDLDGWLTAAGRRVDTGLRPDGLHWSPEGSYWVSDSFLVGSLVDAAIDP
jgi:peptidoglycan/LPS O-acetylase OafA/YrhL